jgi:hypothetical protein
MKRRFRQKQDSKPPDDSEKNKELSEDRALDNVDIDDVIEEIDIHTKTPQNDPEAE